MKAKKNTILSQYQRVSSKAGDISQIEKKKGNRKSILDLFLRFRGNGSIIDMEGSSEVYRL